MSSLCQAEILEMICGFLRRPEFYNWAGVSFDQGDSNGMEFDWPYKGHPGAIRFWTTPGDNFLVADLPDGRGFICHKNKETPKELARHMATISGPSESLARTIRSKYKQP